MRSKAHLEEQIMILFIFISMFLSKSQISNMQIPQLQSRKKKN